MIPFLKNIYKKIFPQLHIISDSHGKVFHHVNFTKKYPRSFCVVEGATASGIKNPNSKTGAKIQIENYTINKVKKKDFVILQLGEVDCGFALWLLSETKGISIDELLTKAISNYSDMIDFIKKNGTNKIIVTSTVLPTIKDSKALGEIANLRKQVNASLLERTNLTLKFNRNIEECCKKKHVNFVSFDKELLDESNSTIKNDYLNEDPTDHHLSHKMFSKLIEMKENEIFRNVNI